MYRHDDEEGVLKDINNSLEMLSKYVNNGTAIENLV